MEITIGLKFKSKWFEGTTTVVSINEDNNSLDVEISSPNIQTRPEKWNLLHTIWGFEQGDYYTDQECHD